jgi:hypothetical protein
LWQWEALKEVVDCDWREGEEIFEKNFAP